MTRLGTYRNRVSDALSALLVLFAVLLAGGQAPLSGQASALSTAQSGGVATGAGSHRSVPAVTKQQVFVSEARDVASAAFDDGHPKALLASRVPDLAPRALEARGAHAGKAVTRVAAAAPFDATGPPSIS